MSMQDHSPGPLTQTSTGTVPDRSPSEASKSRFEGPCACVRDLVRLGGSISFHLGPWLRLEGIEKAERNVPKVWLN